MTPPKVLEIQTPLENDSMPVELQSYRPTGCMNTIKLLKRIEEEGEDVWLDEYSPPNQHSH